MERDEVVCLLILAEELHFGRTAERMRLSRARVSQLVQRLERRVGTPLFVRTSRRVALTELGRQLRDDLEPHQRAMEAALARAAASARRPGGVLHVGFSGPVAGEVVMRAADLLARGHPGLVVDACEVPMSEPYCQLREGDFDVQLVELPAAEDDLDEGPELFAEGRALALPSGHPFAARETVTLEDLADLGGVPLLTGRAELPPDCREQFAPSRTPSGRPIAAGPAVTSLQEALVLVAAGKGVLLTGAHATTYFTRPGVTYVPLADAPPLGYGLVRRTGHDSAALRAFAHAADRAARSARSAGSAGSARALGSAEAVGSAEATGGDCVGDACVGGAGPERGAVARQAGGSGPSSPTGQRSPAPGSSPAAPVAPVV
ncbi:LysR family transcriptional regulator [Streptomyces iconiensis]|uniref:LysR family transcriptional regulator n=1 Tax=Streptomyces iconiensis TaxID=1384038 RepID=A0ABT6ZS01_9ACTN|nr:LysR family transcriptional regulator [Streptomyces iconiensis]MDJ1131835.1 LysR family transcriptional regulator [Streptomyces iconiensis]